MPPPPDLPEVAAARRILDERWAALQRMIDEEVAARRRAGLVAPPAAADAAAVEQAARAGVLGANIAAGKGGVDWLGGNLWIARAPAGGKAPNPPAARPARLVAAAGAAPVGIPFSIPDWCAIDALDQADRAKAGMPAAGAGGLCAAVGLCGPAGNGLVPGWGTAIARLPLGLGSAILQLIRAPIVLVDRALALVPFPRTCDLVRGSAMLLWGAAVGWANALTKGALSPLVRSMQLMRDYDCPTEPVDPETAIALRLRGIFDQTQAVKWGNAHGWCDWKTLWRIAAQQRWYTVEMGWQLWLRGEFRDLEALKIWWRQAGLLDNNVADKEIATRWIPLDRGTILDALIRLRPGRNPQGVTYTEVDARRDLRRLGYEDRSIDVLIALNVRPPMHRMIVSGFEKGTIEESVLQTALQDEGMDPYYVDSLMATYKRLRTHTLRAEMGAPAAPTLVKDAAAGKITPSELASELKLWGLPPNEIAQAESEAQAQTLRDIRAAGITSVRAGYQTGQMGALAAETEMRAFGLDGPTVARLLNLWTLEAQAKRHPDSPATLCAWATKGVIEVREMRERLLLQGYTPLQVAYMVDACTLKATERAQALAAKDASAREKRAVSGVKAVESLVRRLTREAAAKEKAAATAEVTTAREVLGELGREAHEIHAAEHAAEVAVKPPAVRAAEALPEAARDTLPPPSAPPAAPAS